MLAITLKRFQHYARMSEETQAFNADIGAWNTARVTSLPEVCAALGRRMRTAADALGRSSIRRGPLCAAATPMRACADV